MAAARSENVMFLRFSDRKNIRKATSLKSNRKKPQEATSLTSSRRTFVVFVHGGGGSSACMLAMLSCRQIIAEGRVMMHFIFAYRTAETSFGLMFCHTVKIISNALAYFSVNPS